MHKIETPAAADLRVIRLPDAACIYGRGGCADSVIHAARETPKGHRALCDPGRALASIGGRFDIAAEESCGSCAILVVRSGR